jgi:hypothetical protein
MIGRQSGHSRIRFDRPWLPLLPPGEQCLSSLLTRPFGCPSSTVDYLIDTFPLLLAVDTEGRLPGYESSRFATVAAGVGYHVSTPHLVTTVTSCLSTLSPTWVPLVAMTESRSLAGSNER